MSMGSGERPPSSGVPTVQPARNRSLTNSTPIRSSRLSPHTGKQLCPDSRTALDTASTVSGMVRATRSTRGVITSRTTVSRRSCRASMMNCSWASAPPSTGRPEPSPAAASEAPLEDALRRLDRRPGEACDWSSWRRNTDNAVTRSLEGGAVRRRRGRRRRKAERRTRRSRYHRRGVRRPTDAVGSGRAASPASPPRPSDGPRIRRAGGPAA